MTTADEAVHRAVASIESTVALPRKNGELLFDAPWQARVLGMALAIEAGDAANWEALRARLAPRVQSSEADSEPSTFYEEWLATFASLLIERGVISPEEIAARATALRAADQQPH